MRYADAKAIVRRVLSARGYAEADMPFFAPGPSGDTDMQKLSPGPIVFLTVGGGAGQTVEGVFDQPFISVRTIGRQGNYEAAERLAWDVDAGLLSVDRVAGVTTGPIARSGGAPLLLSRDNADRYHFLCSYVTESRSELIA